MQGGLRKRPYLITHETHPPASMGFLLLEVSALLAAIEFKTSYFEFTLQIDFSFFTPESYAGKIFRKMLIAV